MPRVPAIQDYFQFSKGIITEATGLSYPENSMKASMNVDLNFDGSVQRRLGLERHEDSTYLSFTTPIVRGDVVQAFLWENAGESLDLDILVVRHASQLHMYDNNYFPLSDGYLGTYDIGDGDRTTHASFASGNGFLFVSAGSMPHVIEYRTIVPKRQRGFFSRGMKIPLSQIGFVGGPIVPMVRDIEGMDDGTDSSSRRYSSDELGGYKYKYLYNLLNQGWLGTPIQSAHKKFGTNMAWDHVHRSVGAFPAHSEMYTNTALKFDSDSYSALTPTSTKPSRGKFIIEMFNPDRAKAVREQSSGGGASHLESTILAEIDLYDKTSPIDAYPTTVGFFQGHAIMGGIDHKEFASQILISQSIKSLEDINRFYSVNDPTEEIESSPLPTDGGVLTINGMGRLIKVVDFGQWCLLFATNGVWSMRGGLEEPFSISTVTVNKVSDIGAVSVGSVLEAEGFVTYWSHNGIYAISADESGSTLRSQSMTENTVDTLYKKISPVAIGYSSGVYDNYSKRIYWLYNSGLISDDGETAFYNKALIYDTRLQAFYEYEFPPVSNEHHRLCAPFSMKGKMRTTEANLVMSGEDFVEAGDDDVVSSEMSLAATTAQSLNFIFVPRLSNGKGTGFASLVNKRFKDWGEYDEVWEEIKVPVLISDNSIPCFTQFFEVIHHPSNPDYVMDISDNTFVYPKVGNATPTIKRTSYSPARGNEGHYHLVELSNTVPTKLPGAQEFVKNYPKLPDVGLCPKHQKEEFTLEWEGGGSLSIKSSGYLDTTIATIDFPALMSESTRDRSGGFFCQPYPMTQAIITSEVRFGCSTTRPGVSPYGGVFNTTNLEVYSVGIALHKKTGDVRFYVNGEMVGGTENDIATAGPFWQQSTNRARPVYVTSSTGINMTDSLSIDDYNFYYPIRGPGRHSMKMSGRFSEMAQGYIESDSEPDLLDWCGYNQSEEFIGE